MRVISNLKYHKFALNTNYYFINVILRAFLSKLTKIYHPYDLSILSQRHTAEIHFHTFATVEYLANRCRQTSC